MPSLRNSLNKMKAQKLDTEQKLRSTSNINSSPVSYTPHYLQLPVPDLLRDLDI